VLLREEVGMKKELLAMLIGVAIAAIAFQIFFGF
jgi:hypothetical protein